jgi:hypothetical protein
MIEIENAMNVCESAMKVNGMRVDANIFIKLL